MKVNCCGIRGTRDEGRFREKRGEGGELGMCLCPTGSELV